MIIKLAPIGALLLSGSVCAADIINVPADQPTISDGIGAASSGDEVVVAPGTYQESVIVPPGVSVRSSGGPGVTTIESPGASAAVQLGASPGAPASIVEGFTITTVPMMTGIGVRSVSPGDVTMRDCVIIGFESTGVECVSQSGATFEDCTITGNGEGFSQSSGVNCISPNARPTFLRCTISANAGPGVLVESGSHPTFIGCTIDGNVSDERGGGVSIRQASATLIDAIIENNQSDSEGGGISLELGSTCSLRESVVRNNSAGDALDGTLGGGVFLNQEGNVLVARNSVFDANNASEGAAIACDPESSVQLIDSSIINHRAAGGQGAGVIMEDRSELLAIDTRFENNSFELSDTRGLGLLGGAIASFGADLLLDGCEFIGNGANDEVARGGAVYCSLVSNATFPATVAFFDCSFTDNASGETGGAVHFDPQQFDVRLLLDGCSFTGNRCDGDFFSGQGTGGAVYGPVEAYACSFVGNRAVYAGAYGVDPFSGGPFPIRSLFVETSFMLNSARDGAGVLSTNDRDVRMESCSFRQNSSTSGPALFNFNVNPGTLPLVLNSELVGNVGQGLIDGSAHVLSCTVAANDARESQPFQSGLIENCVIAANASGFFGRGSPLTVRHSLIENEVVPGDGNISADPLFVVRPDPGFDEQWGTIDDNHGDVRLAENSPAIDAGDTFAYPGWPPVDFAGMPRFADAGTPDTGLGGPPVIDMGAFEFQGESPALCVGDITTTGTTPGDPGYGQPDGLTNLTDLLYFVNMWDTDLGIPSPNPGSIADVTTTGAGAGQAGFGQPDGNVDLSDLLFYVNDWNAGLLQCP